MEKSLVLLKPGTIKRKIIGEIISRFERKNLDLVALKLLRIDEAAAVQHYIDHLQKPFMRDLVDYITSGPIVASVWQGNNCIEIIRNMVGDVHLEKAAPGTIQWYYSNDINFNVVHASDSEKFAKREIELFFDYSEIISEENS